MSQPIAITIGNFDGVHLGHQELVRAGRAAVDLPGRKPGQVIALVFDPHPLTVLRPEKVPDRLSTFDQRTRWLTEAGADKVLLLKPTPHLLSQTPQEFLESLIEHYHPSVIVEGPDFRFGRGRSGSIQTLKQLQNAYGYHCVAIQPVEAALSNQAIVPVSSSMIRWLLIHGRVEDVGRLLGRPHELSGTVVPGERRGRMIGVPTVNLDPHGSMLPGDGVYAGVAHRPGGRSFPAAISIGAKPTFGRHARVCEAHLIGYSGPLDEYGWEVRLQVHRWLRDQLTYTNVDMLIDQIHRDIARVKPLGGPHLAASATDDDSSPTSTAQLPVGVAIPQQ